MVVVVRMRHRLRLFRVEFVRERVFAEVVVMVVVVVGRWRRRRWRVWWHAVWGEHGVQVGQVMLSGHVSH